jgi:hypothetical protein
LRACNCRFERKACGKELHREKSKRQKASMDCPGRIEKKIILLPVFPISKMNGSIQ